MTDLSGLQRFCGKLFLSILLVFVGGCGGGRWLMPTPNLYSGSDGKAFDDVPEVFRSNIIDVLYVTDRKSVVAGTAQFGTVTGVRLLWRSVPARLRSARTFRGKRS